jgi:hypothetical protein
LRQKSGADRGTDLELEGNPMMMYLRHFVLVFAFSTLATLAAGSKEKVIIVSWGDLIGDHTGDKRYDGAIRVDRPENMKTLAGVWKARGVNKVLFRVDDWRYLHFMELYMPDGGGYTDYRRVRKQAWDSGLLAAAVDALKSAGIEMYMWISIIDEGCPPTVAYADTVPWPWQSRFFRDHPQYQACDRTPTENGRKYQWGIPEFAYPEVRAHILSEITFFSDKFAFDGVFLSFRSHSPPPEHGDQFGFNAPVVEEYQRRYGKNILREDFDLERWRALRGEYFTTFLRQVHDHVSAHGQKLSLGVPQGEHAGPPVGNMQLQWRNWVSEKLVGELVIGHHTLTRSIYRHHWQLGWGYVQDQDGRVGLPPVEQALEEGYGPFCQKHGVKVYVDVPLGNFHRTFDDPTMGKGVETPEATASFVAKLERIPNLTGIVLDCRPFNIAP